jgi:hypothetical protein
MGAIRKTGAARSTGALESWKVARQPDTPYRGTVTSTVLSTDVPVASVH